MKRLLDLLKRHFQLQAPADVNIKPARKRRVKPDWRIEAIKAAGERHGKAFKVGPDHLAREMMTKPGEFTVVKPKDAQQANVTPIAGKKARGA